MAKRTGGFIGYNPLLQVPLVYQGVWSLSTQYQNASGWPAAPNVFGDIGLIAGGETPSSTASIEYVNIATSGIGTTFGDLTQARNSVSGCGSSTRGVFGGGANAGLGYNAIDFVTFSTTGNATDFGEFANVSGRDTAALSNETRGVFGGGTEYNNIEYITIASVGNAIDFGDMTTSVGRMAGCSSVTRGVWGGGNSSNPESNIIQYVTIATAGNATDFGDLAVVMNRNMAVSSSTRGVFAAGFSSGDYNTTINYITIATTGNATDFGDMVLKVGGAGNGNLSNKTYGLFASGNSNLGDYQLQISYITIASTGNTLDFGDLITGRNKVAACSNAHGGLA
jgi:hypothetical protein